MLYKSKEFFYDIEKHQGISFKERGDYESINTGMGCRKLNAITPQSHCISRPTIADFDIICFHAQQCIEKYLKGMASRSEYSSFSRSHDLEALLGLIVPSYSQAWHAWQTDFCGDYCDLMRWNLRYPGKSATAAEGTTCCDIYVTRYVKPTRSELTLTSISNQKGRLSTWKPQDEQ